ncbi:undecaprenyldiphospho-muramoylpentapeptide beta-N-acetylglucosaminyltransferase [Enterococcus timonensis]|uniref:undecaprenyldiphospho-muramoylpentapeptide beta-N-acetylglucosaminyltransferase n=1 Tax=Enterococcus timonensis TaxID=1852364 RepID=UPI0008DAD1A0|nr:undecaprenyldiphospho-muramoylpentapeptide beta-N-acetylglucosaminyltransferase [Enterococcus timonensis]
MKILMTGGGTGGHIYPALAFIDYVKTQDASAEFMYVGAKRGLENKILPETDIPYEMLEIQGFKRSLSLGNFKTLHLFFKSVRDGKKILKKFQPDVVIGTGGYVSGAMVYAASRLKIPTIIHEQNSVPGITNKFLARYVQAIAISIPQAASYFPTEKVVLTGNPRASQIVLTKKSDVLTQFGLDPAKKTVLIFGGSQGAKKFNDVILASLSELAQKSYQVLYASGERYFAAFNQQKIPKNVVVVPYLKNMQDILGNIALLVGRAGATSIAEFTAIGLASILIPSPYVTNDHQTKNAQSLAEAGAAVIVKDAELTKENLITELDSLLNDSKKLAIMAEASKELGHPDAAEHLFKVVKEVLLHH